MNLPETLSYNGVTISLASESPERLQNAVSYLLAYGFGKSLQDAVAGLKKSMTAEGADAATIAAAIEADMTARAEAILSGTIGLRGPRAVGPEAVKRTVIEEWFKAWAKAQADKGKVLPSLKSMFGVSAKDATDEQKKAVAEKLGALKAKFADAKATAIEEEVARRLATQGDEEDELDLDI